MTSRNFEAVLFDMDGLTIDSEPQWLEAEQELTAPFGYSWTVEDQAFCLGGPLSKVGQYMADLTGAENGEYFHMAIINLMAEKVSRSAKLMPGAQELLNNLQISGVPIGLVSASPRVIVNAALGNLQGIKFNVTISSDDVTNTKPDPEGYLEAAKRIGVNIRECLILEDSATGVAAARASGARVIAIPHIVKIEADSQTKIFKSLEELNLDLLSELYGNW